jgi:proteic killer suppression protein
MIISFQHKDLEILYRTGSGRGVRPDHVRKLTRILSVLDIAASPRGVDLPGYRLHALSGQLSGHWSVRVTGSWRVTFRFLDHNVELVNHSDYH